VCQPCFDSTISSVSLVWGSQGEDSGKRGPISQLTDTHKWKVTCYLCILRVESGSISRILSSLAGWTIISLGRLLPDASSTLPGSHRRATGCGPKMKLSAIERALPLGQGGSEALQGRKNRPLVAGQLDLGPTRFPMWACSGRGLASRHVSMPLVGSYPTISPLPGREPGPPGPLEPQPAIRPQLPPSAVTALLRAPIALCRDCR
jgi:hypothetical protein